MMERVRAEFMEMPGLRLTPAQVQRLCGIESMMCKAVLATHLRPAKAELSDTKATVARKAS